MIISSQVSAGITFLYQPYLVFLLGIALDFFFFNYHHLLSVCSPPLFQFLLVLSLHMYSEFKSLSFMGVSDSQMFLSEKDLHAMELNFLVRPTLEFQDDQDHGLHKKPETLKEEEEGEEEEENKCKISVVPSLELIKIPSVAEFRDDVEDDDDGFKTPTSLDHKIPVIRPCPPPPRKPKTITLTKRKAARQRILLDLSNDIEALFPPALLVDLSGKTRKSKKIRQEDETIS
jgi:hypothetical protein